MSEAARSSSELVAWLRERMPARRFIPLALALVLLGGGLEARRVPLLGLAWVWLAVFRLRDDIVDLARDRVHAPQRVLCRASSLRPFERAWTIAVVLALALTAFLQGLGHARMFAGLLGAFELAYARGLPGRHRWVLLKYPAIVLLLGDRLDLATLGVAMLAYLSLALFERVDDARLRERPDARVRESALVLLAALLALALLVHAGAPWPWLAALALTATLALALLHAGKPELAPLALACLAALAWANDRHHSPRSSPGVEHARDPALLCLRQ